MAVRPIYLGLRITRNDNLSTLFIKYSISKFITAPQLIQAVTAHLTYRVICFTLLSARSVTMLHLKIHPVIILLRNKINK
jgi:hypothetical protein